MFNLALFLQRLGNHAEAATWWTRYLERDRTMQCLYRDHFPLSLIYGRYADHSFTQFMALLTLAGVGLVYRDPIKQFALGQYYWRMVMGPSVLTAGQEREKVARPGSDFKECANGCPMMIVVPAGKFIMGSPKNEPDRSDNEGPRQEVIIAKPFAVSKFEATFAEWDACVDAGTCPRVPDVWGREQLPAINVSWDEATAYMRWLSHLTGKEYRLLTEAEWEYAARAGTQTRYFLGR